MGIRLKDLDQQEALKLEQQELDNVCQDWENNDEILGDFDNPETTMRPAQMPYAQLTQKSPNYLLDQPEAVQGTRTPPGNCDKMCRIVYLEKYVCIPSSLVETVSELSLLFNVANMGALCRKTMLHNLA